MNDAQNPLRILMVGAGSGGHFYPLIAIAEALRATAIPCDLYFAGPDPYDADALTALHITHIHISAGKRRKYRSILNVLDSFKVLWGTLIAIVKLYVLYPDVVMSKGGYTSVPVILAAAFLRIPIVIHESDAVMGSANKIAARFARHIIVAYDELAQALPHKPVLKLGIPTRSIFLDGPSPHALERFGIDPNRPVILVIGGSQGAERINALILDALDELLTDLSIIHQTGKANYDVCKLSAEQLVTDPVVRSNYHPVPFFDAVAFNDAYHLASIVISRAGSGSIYEIALHGKPSILIPIPEEISHDQRTNAFAYARVSGASVMEEHNLTDSLLRAEIDRIMGDTALYERMTTGAREFAQADAAQQTASVIIQVAQTH